jgi:hypothetical protein
MGTGRPGLAEPRLQPFCDGGGSALARAVRGHGPRVSAAPWHGRLDAFIPRSVAAACADFHGGCPGSPRAWLHRAPARPCRPVAARYGGWCGRCARRITACPRARRRSFRRSGDPVPDVSRPTHRAESARQLEWRAAAVTGFQASGPHAPHSTVRQQRLVVEVVRQTTRESRRGGAIAAGRARNSTTAACSCMRVWSDPRHMRARRSP